MTPVWSALDLLPGCYAAALALLLAAALERWYDSVPRRVTAAAFLTIGLLFGGALFGGKILLPLDNLRGEVPFRQLPRAVPQGNLIQGDLLELVVPSLTVGGEALAAGRWPLWNARVGAGMHLLADPQAQALSPFTLLALPLTPARGAVVVAALRVFVAQLFTFLLLRRQGMGIGPAIAGGLAFGLCGFVVLWVGWPLASVAALLPAVLYSLTRVAAADGAGTNGGRGRDGLLLSLALAALLLAGHPETIFYACLLAAAFGASLIWRRPRGARLRAVASIAAAAAVALGIAAPALLPAAAYLPQSLRVERLAESADQARREATRRPAAPGAEARDLARRWLPVAAPNAYGNSRYVDYWGSVNSNEDDSAFAGTVMLLAAALALVGGTAGAKRLPGEGLFLAAAAVCLLVLADPAPLHAALAAVSPALAGSGRCRMVLAFCIAYLGACTLERHRRGELDRLSILALAAALAALIAWAYLAHADPADPQRLAVLRLGWLRWQARFLVGATFLLALCAGGAAGALKRLTTGALAAAVAAELLLAHAPANPPMPARLAFPQPTPLGILAAVAGPASGDRIAALGRALPPNLAAAYGLTDLRIYNPMAPAPYLALLAPITTAWWGESPELGAPNDPLYRRLGVRYLLTAPNQNLDLPWQLVVADPTGWLYWQREPWPRLYTAAAPDADPLPAGLTLKTFGDQEIQALLPAAAVASGTVAPGAAAVAVVAPTPGAAGAPRWLAGSLYQDGSWRLLVDRRPVPTPPARRLLAAPLPADARRIDLLYRPTGFVLGLLAAALALAAATVLWTPPPATPLRPAPRGPSAHAP